MTGRALATGRTISSTNLTGMDVEVARWLVSAAATPWLAQAAAETDPSSPATARRWRRHLSAEQATVVLDQIALRRRAVKKLGDWADQVFLTRDGLEMATRREVARWRARRLVEAGVTSLVDAGTGLGIDAMAAAEAGLAVQGWERDLVLAILAQANLETLKPVAPASVNVHQLDDLTHLTGRPDQALYLDPARRSAAGPSWSVDQLSPAWSTVTAALTSAVGPVVVKLGPGLPHHLIPAPTQATWVSHDGDLVELSLWRGPTWAASWQAVSLPSGRSLPGGQPAPATGPLGRFLWEPDPAVIRARALAPLAEQLAAHGLVDQIAYLTGDADRLTPWAQRFEVLEVLPFDDKKVRAWIRQRGIGHLEIKTRGLGLDPARWRRRLGLKGPERATVIVTPSPTGAVVLVVCRQPTRC